MPTPSAPPATCRYCEAPGEYLCDFVEEEARGKQPARTCDAPLCRQHRVVIAQGITCSRSRKKGHGRCCVPFSIDRCLFHAPLPQERS